ncbi:MAG: hemerythrin [Rubrivivax sp. SCN 71-131]|nr:MAG: hemerythrin [Rubrivivax sp. SCN 71-131]
MNLEKFKEQHVQILRHVDDLRRLSRGGISDNAPGLAGGVVAMSSLIKLHLAAEELALYPALQRSGNSELAQLGARFQSDMRPIAAAFDAFARRWNTAQAIRADADGFRRAANETLRCLWERMRLENRDFYPKVETTRA